MNEQRSKIPTQEQISSGGVAFRRAGADIEIALISVRAPASKQSATQSRPSMRWQLPKGLVDEDESPAETALREVREEAGIETELLAPIDVIEYWYVGHSRGQRVRFHKFVHFFLLRYRGGDVREHDHEVREARWVPVDEALEMLSFKNEREVVARAQSLIVEMDAPDALA